MRQMHPDYGRLVYDLDGKIVCHVCGRSYRQLTNTHLDGHDLTNDEYKERFGLNRQAALMSKGTHGFYQQRGGNPDLDKYRPKDAGGSKAWRPHRAQGLEAVREAVRRPEYRQAVSDRQNRPHPCRECGAIVPTTRPQHCPNCISLAKAASGRLGGLQRAKSGPRNDNGRFVNRGPR